MTGRTSWHVARAAVVATMTLTLTAGPAAALAPPGAGPAANGSPAVDRLVPKKFDGRGFPSWSNAAAEAREAVTASRSGDGRRMPAAEASAEAIAAGGHGVPGRERQGAAKAASGTSRPGDPADIDDAVTWSQGHAGGRDMALALTAAGIPFGSNVGRADIVRAGGELGVAFGPRIDSGEIERVRERAWRYGGLRMSASGLDFEGRLDPHDIALRAEELGIQIGAQVDPGDIVAVLAAGQQGLSELLDRGGFPHGDVVNTSDLETAARLHGVRIGKSLRGADARRIANEVAKKGDPNRTLLFAKVGKVDFHLPGRRPEYIGFHQASNPRVLPFKRWGLPLSDFLPSRSRGTHRAGAVDIPMPPGDPVYAPVSGTVVEAKRYSLYGKYTDERLRIIPDDDPRMLTTVLHMRNMRVRVGDRIVAGETVIAEGARKFPFWSQVDGYSGRPWGHVHVETRWR